VWEGGIRVPFIVRGPGIKADSWCHEPVVGYDVFPTFCRLAGVKEKLPANVEGGDISALFAGTSNAVSRTNEGLVFHFPHYQGDTPHSAIRLGDYKLLEFYETGERVLFNLKTDLAERNDIAKSNPEIAADLGKRLKTYLAGAGAAMPKPNPDYKPGEEPTRRKGNKGGGKKGGAK
jgi:arylsulfatase A-like enzyme